jgi:hypothetical protein
MNQRTLPLLAAACLATAATAALADEASTYSRKDLVVGTMIPKAYLTSNVPFDKTWAQLDAAQKAAVDADYETMPAGDEPPFPKYGLGHLVEPANKLFQNQSWDTPFVAAVSVGPDGAAREIKVFRSPDPRVTKVLAALLVKEPFKPAVCGGQACVRDFVLRLEFPARDAQPVWRTAHQFYGDVTVLTASPF